MTAAPKRLIVALCPFLGFGDRPFNLLGHPYALARTALHEVLGRLAPTLPPGPLLDVGCGTMPYRNLFPDALPYEGLEIDQERTRANPRVTHFYDGHSFSMEANLYVSILCSQVLEHSFAPERLLAECHRVLRPGGVLLLTIPFLWPEHEQPWDSQRFTSFGLAQRLEAVGFELVSLHKTNPGLSALLQLSIEWLESLSRVAFRGIPFPWLRTGMHVLWRLLSALPYTILNLMGALYRSWAPLNLHSERTELYLDLVVTARKP